MADFEPNDEQIERTARMLFARTKEGRDGFSWPLNPGVYKERDLEAARSFLIRALGPEGLAEHDREVAEKRREPDDVAPGGAS